jgi:outer membrane protein TolC
MAADVSRVSYQAATTPGYCNLPEKEAQCLAAMHAPQARLLEQEAEAATTGGCVMLRKTQAPTTAEALRLQAAHERNRNASAALQLLYRIAGAETAADNLRRQLNEVRGTLVDLGRLQRAGIEMPLSLPETEANQADVLHKIGELELTIDLLNEQLANLMGVDLAPGSRFWPDISLQVDPAVPPVEEAQMTALAQRADLAALRVAASGGPETVRTLLSLSGMPVAGASGLCLHPRAKHEQAAIREEQIQGAIADKQRTIRHEVAQAVATIQARLNQIALAEQRLELLRDHREAVRRKQESGVRSQESAERPTTMFDLRKATIAALAADQDLFHDVIEWKVAVSKLKEAEGELAIECGFTDVFDYANCCR